MKLKRIITSAAALALVISFVPGVAYAVEDGNTSSSSPTQTETNAEKTAEQKAAELKQRLEQKKTELKTKLSAAQQTRVKTKCKAAQGLTSSLTGRVEGIEKSRSEVYTNLLNRLNSLTERLKAAGVDTTQLDSQVAELKTKIDTFNTDLSAYKQSLSDLSSVDCVTDPSAFQAALESARTARTKVAQDAAGIRQYVKETLKATLQTAKASLESKKTESQEGEATNGQ